MKNECVDVAVIGAGIVGLAIAAELSDAGVLVAVVEKYPQFGQETSSRSSEVIHSGIYYPPGSVKARLCVTGNRMIYETCARHGIGHRRTGKIVAAVDARESACLEELLATGRANGVEDLSIVGAAEAAALEPRVRAASALLVPSTGIVDSHGLMRHYYLRAKEADTLFVFGREVTGISYDGEGYALRFSDEDEVKARTVVNAAGLYADRIAAMAGIDIDAAGYRIGWLKGDYFRLPKGLEAGRLIYPVPDRYSLGVHHSFNLAGQTRFGPDACFTDHINYDVDSAKAGAFAQDIARYLPGITASDLVPDSAGIRPQLPLNDAGFADFIIREESPRGLPNLVNLIGINSPGLTAAPAIAQAAAALITIR